MVKKKIFKKCKMTVENTQMEKPNPFKKDDDEYVLLLSSIYIISELTNIKFNSIVKFLKLEEIIL